MDDSESLDVDFQHEPPSANEAVAKLRLRLRNQSLAELAEKGVLEWDSENDVVRKGPNFEAETPN